MRGGALPILAWGLILAISGATNAVWTGDSIQIGTFAAAVVATLLTAAVLIARSHQAAHRGEPTAPSRPEPVTHTSFGTVIAAVGVGTVLFGLVFGHFIVYFGAGLIAVGLGRLAVELHHQRRAEQRR
jgi:uncharacterized membrane protein YfcA